MVKDNSVPSFWRHTVVSQINLTFGREITRLAFMAGSCRRENNPGESIHRVCR